LQLSNLGACLADDQRKLSDRARETVANVLAEQQIEVLKEVPKFLLD
jgi:hypothetical protein